jgi:catechol 2,3-dioxygenase-like lactoylglutathione lyase family enzyme
MSFNARFVATLPAADLARAKAWYADKLGLNPSTEFHEIRYIAGTGDTLASFDIVVR